MGFFWGFFLTLHHNIVFYRHFENITKISHKSVMETGRLCVSLRLLFTPDKNGLAHCKMLEGVKKGLSSAE